MTASAAFWMIGAAGLLGGWSTSTVLQSFHWYHATLNRCARCGNCS